MVKVGFETLPRRMTGLPAIKLSLAVVMSRSSPMGPVSPGTAPGQRGITRVSEAEAYANANTRKATGNKLCMVIGMAQGVNTRTFLSRNRLSQDRAPRGREIARSRGTRSSEGKRIKSMGG